MGCLLLKKKRIIVFAAVFAAVTAADLLLARGDDDYFKVVLAVFGFLWAFYIFSALMYPVFICRAWMKEPGLASPSELTADDTGIFAKNPQMETAYQWSGFTKFAESRGLFALSLGKRMLMVVPKDSFENEADVARFRDLLNRNIPTQRKLR